MTEQIIADRKMLFQYWLEHKLAMEVLLHVIIMEKYQSIATILGAPDSAVQNNVNDAVDNLFAQ